jgi:hypothetical protein
MNCPHCNIKMGTTYEPYEYRCTKCGYWFDSWTGKEVTFAPPDDDDGLLTCSVCRDRYTTSAAHGVGRYATRLQWKGCSE